MCDDFEQLIAEAHAEVDEIRAAKGLAPWPWRMLMTDRREPLENITVDGMPLKVYVAEQTRTEIEKVAGDEVRQKSAGIGYQAATGKFENISGERSQRRDHALAATVSPEVKEKANFLAKHLGDNAMTKYLNENRNEGGTIEKAIEDAKERLAVLRRTKQEVDLEIARYEAVQDGLSQTLQVLLGHPKAAKASKSGRGMPAGTEKAPHGLRVNQIKEILSQGPATRKELWTKLIEAGCGKDPAYQVIHTSIKKGRIMEREGKLYWMGA